MTVADKILKMRKEQGLSQEAFAEKLGVSRQSVSKWESGAAVPDTEKILAVSELFGVSTDYLLKDEEAETPAPVEEREDAFMDEKDLEVNTVKIAGGRKNIAKIIISVILALAVVVTAVAIPVYYGSYKEAWWELNGGKIQYPYVLVHGLGGWGDGDGINESAKYWGSGAGDLKAYLTEQGYTVYTPSVGPVSSAWDRACELYAQLTGTQVDYGEAHSKEHGHDRFGEEFDTALVENWGEKINGGQRVKINLVGHSFGGATVRLLTSLLEYGSDAEIDATGDETSPLFTGGKGDRVNSVTALCAPHNGSSLTEIINDAGSILGIGDTTSLLVNLCFNIAGISEPVSGIYDFKLDHFGIGAVEGDESDVTTAVGNFIKVGKDNAVYDLSPDGAAELNKTIKTVEDVYYFSYAYSTTKEGSLLKGQVPDSGTFTLLYPVALAMGSYTGTTDGGIVIDETWQENDGLVNVVSAQFPAGENHIDFPTEEDAKFERGIWYVAPTSRGHHGTVIGLGADTESTQKFYTDLFETVDALKR